MKKIHASDAKNRFGGMLEEVALSGRVDIVKHGRVVAVVLSPRAFEQLRSERNGMERLAPSHMFSPSDAKNAVVLKRAAGFDDD